MALDFQQTPIFEEVANASNPRTLTFPSDTTAGHFLVWAISYNGGGVDTTSVSHNKSGTPVSVINELGPNSKTRLRVWSIVSGGFGASHQFSLNPGGSNDQAVHWGVMPFNDEVDVAAMIDAVSDGNGGTCAGADANASTTGAPADGNVWLLGFAGTRGDFGTINLNTPAGWTNVRLQNTATGGIGSSVCRKAVTIAGGGAQAIAFSHDGSDSAIDWVSAIVVVREASGTTVTEITDVGGTEQIRAAQTNIAATGTGFGSTQGAGKLEIRQGTVFILQPIDSWADTVIQFDARFEHLGQAVVHGDAFLRVTTNLGAIAEIPVTLLPAAGQLYVILTSVNATEAYRLVALPNLAPGCRIWAVGLDQGAAPTGLIINQDGTHGWETGATEAPWLARLQDVDTMTYQPAWALQYYTADPPAPNPGASGPGVVVPTGRGLSTPPMRIKWRRP